jgi:hypothetical protein
MSFDPQIFFITTFCSSLLILHIYVYHLKFYQNEFIKHDLIITSFTIFLTSLNERMNGKTQRERERVLPKRKESQRISERRCMLGLKCWLRRINAMYYSQTNGIIRRNWREFTLIDEFGHTWIVSRIQSKILTRFKHHFHLCKFINF